MAHACFVVSRLPVQVPFGIAQVGKAFRNEITPRNFIFRSREFEQMEVEYFVEEGDAWKQVNGTAAVSSGKDWCCCWLSC